MERRSPANRGAASRLPRARARHRRVPSASTAPPAVSRALRCGAGAIPCAPAPPAISRAARRGVSAIPGRARRPLPLPPRPEIEPGDPRASTALPAVRALVLGADRDSLRPRRTALFPACSRSAAVAIPAARRPRGLRRSRARRRRAPPEHGAPASPAVALGAGAIPRGHRAPRHLLSARARRRRDPRERGAPRGLCALGLGVGAIPREHRAPRRFLNARARRRRDPSWARSTPRFPEFVGGRPSLLRPSPSYHRRFCASSPGT